MHFWSKKAVHENLNDYELCEEVRDELSDYGNSSYSYYA